MSQDSIRVVCRLRTFNKIETANNGEECVQFDQTNIKINVGGDQNKYNFSFDKILGPAAQQTQVYQQVAIPVIKSLILGYNSTIFAYGQTGAGKTWTMEGPNHYDTEFKGLIPRTVDGIFQEIRQSDESIEFVIRCSYVQIYNQKIFDLLDPSKARLEIKEDKMRGVFIQNCTQIPVGSPQQMLKVMNNGSQNRKVAFTGMNQRSSRSHSLFIIHVSQKHTKKDSTKQSRLYFVDLAGSEKVSKTGVMGAQLQQAKNINKSLSALGNVINALTSQKKEHIPYRDSKLTRILQQSLGGNSKTTLVICCSMSSYNDKETLSTLRFGYRAKSIKNKAKVNQQRSAKELLMLLEAANRTISDLKLQLKTGIISQPSPLMNSQHPQASPQLLQQVQSQQCEIEQLKRQLGEMLMEEEEKEKSLKQYQFRMKSILLEVDRQKMAHLEHIKGCSSTFKNFKQFMQAINKYVKRAVIDIQYYLNSSFVDAMNPKDIQKSQLTTGTKKPNMQELNNQSVNTQTQDSNPSLQLKNSLATFLHESEQYLAFYDDKLKSIFDNLERQANCRDLDNFEIHSDRCEEPHEQYFVEDQSFKSEGQNQKRRLRVALSQPQLFAQQYEGMNNKQELQMSFIYQRPIEESMAITTSDKVSQEESFTEIETLLESLETKESHKILLEELNAQLKLYKKDNDELTAKIEKFKHQNKTIQKNLEAKYDEMLTDLEQRAEQYKNIIGKKDQEIQLFFKKQEQIKKALSQEKVVSERFKKIIESNTSMKQYHDMEERLRALASERQKLFNEMFKLRESLDEAELTIKEKEEHIESLKQVMKQLSESVSNSSAKCQSQSQKEIDTKQSHEEIQKRYNTKIYGTEVPNVIQPIRGGDSGKKKSSLRRRIPIEVKKEQKNANQGIGSYLKGFFG